MKLLSTLTIVFLSIPAFANPLKFKVSGMHCSACSASITKDVCKKDLYAKCDVKITDATAQTGEVNIETKPGQKADTAEILKTIDKLGYKAELATTPATQKGS